jgi:hypothetical protein
MAETFWLVPEGVSALSAQVDRARVDAEQAKGHVERYCTLSLGEVGVLPDTFGSSGAHKRTVALVRDTLGDLAERTRYVVDGIGASVLDYQTIEDETSRVFTDLASILGRGSDLGPPNFQRYGPNFLDPPGPPFSDLAEPTEVLRDPGIGQQQPLWEFDLYSPDTFSPPSWVREVIKNIASRDPFEDAVRWLSGDWTAYERVLFEWVQIKQFSERVGQNLARAALELPGAWKGREADAAQWYLHTLADATTDFGLFCGELVGHYRNAVQAAKAFNGLAAGILADLAINAGLAAAATAAMTAAQAAQAAPYPLVKAAAWAAVQAARATLAVLATRIAVLVKRLSDGYDTFQKVMDGLAATVNTYQFTRIKALAVQRSLR